MTRMATGLGIAVALGFAVTAGAQTATTSTTTSSQQQTTTSRSDKDHEITVSGCLARSADGTFMLNNAHMANSMDRARSDASTTTTGAATTTGTTGSSAVGTTAAEPANPATTTDREGAKGSAMSWKLEGGTDLDRHVGHTIQVTGRTEWNEHSAASSSSSATTTTSSSGARLDVSSIKMVSSSCQ